jgi:hypothetical protein
MPNVLGPLFKTGDYLHQGDYMVSRNGIFCAVLDNNGLLYVYRTPFPDYNNIDSVLTMIGSQQPPGVQSLYLFNDGNLVIFNPSGVTTWSTQLHLSPGPKCLYLHDDGVLGLYSGSVPNSSPIWSSGKSDPVKETQIKSIVYDLDSARSIQNDSPEIYRQTLSNHSSQQQTQTISQKRQKSETSGWSDSIGISVGVQTSFKTGIPIIASGKVKVSLDMTTSFTWNGSTERSTEWDIDVPVTVDPGRAVEVLVTVDNSSLIVPYTLTADIVFSSGNRLDNHQIKGVYTGSDSYNLTTIFRDVGSAAGS